MVAFLLPSGVPYLELNLPFHVFHIYFIFASFWLLNCLYASFSLIESLFLSKAHSSEPSHLDNLGYLNV